MDRTIGQGHLLSGVRICASKCALLQPRRSPVNFFSAGDTIASLNDKLALCGHEDISALDLLDALATIGLKLVPDAEGTSGHEYMSAHKSVISSPKADLN